MRYILLIMLILAGAELSAQEQVALSGEKLFAGGQFVQMVQTDSGHNDSPSAIQPFNYKNTKEWKRYRLFQALGWSCAVVGSLSTGICICLCSLCDFYTGSVSSGCIAFVAMSGTVLLASVPMFILSYKYKKKAKSLKIGASALSVPSSQGFRSTPGLSVAFTF